MPARTTGDAESDRQRKLNEVTQRLAQEHGRRAIPVPHAEQWLDSNPRIGTNDIIVAWTVADAALIRHQLRDRIAPERVFAAAPRWRRPPPASNAEDIPTPRR